MIRKGKSLAQRLSKARILLKSDVSEDGEGWSDSRIIEALETSVAGLPGAQAIGGRRLEAVSSRKSAGCARRGADFRRREGGPADRAGLLQTAFEGYARWSLRLPEEQGGGTASSRPPATRRSSVCSKKLYKFLLDLTDVWAGRLRSWRG